MLLSRLVEAAERLGATRSRTTKVQVLAGLLGACPPEEAEAVVGLLLGRPRQGRVGVGWRLLAAARAEAEAGPPDASLSAVPVSAEAPDPQTLTVAEVDATLTTLAALAGPGSASRRHTVLVDLLTRAAPEERDLLVRALTGEVRTGALDGLVTDALAAAVGRPAATVRRAVMLTGSLGGTARLALTDPDALDGVGLTVGVPVHPMLASTATDPGAALAVTGEASVEHKLDGARIQVHRRGDVVGVWTRSLADVTPRVPEIVQVVRSLPVTEVILDGETLALDESGAPRPFQDTMSRFGADAVREQVLSPWFFDVLHVDGRDLVDEPLRHRLEVLERIAPGHRVPGAVTDDPEVAQRVLEEALRAGHEGVVVKGVDSPYAAGRRGRSWLKVKPVHTVDLVVLAAEWGSGRRRGWLSNLHLGALDPDGAHGPAGGLVMVGKTFKGLTDELLRWQTETFPRHEAGRSAGVVHLRPELVVEVALDGVQRSPRYAGGLALRFARVRRYRPDKTPAEADTIGALRALLHS
ncbi:MAG TPA: ATP-dependent DNA ligase [Dermatophilaceae bacterium]|nr:ATP-dependent DNA ligase [Dermatophilaceae bacterium]